MTRVMFWNLNNFGTGAYFPTNVSRKRKGNPDPEYGASTSADATSRRNFVRDLVRAVNPQILVVVEVKPGPGGAAQGALVNDNAAERIRRTLGGNAWSLVPPIVTGAGARREGVAVFYRRVAVQFVGPWCWNGATTVPYNGAVAAAYGAPWAPSLPHRQLNNAAWPNQGAWEDRLGGQWQYPGGGGGTEFPFAGFRRPWLVQFGERAGAGRLLSILAYHAPPQQVPPPVAVGPVALALAVAGTAAVAGLAFVTAVNNAGEVRCVAGDFNISVYDGANDPLSYQLLRNAGFRQEIWNSVGGVAVPDAAPFRGYLATHLRGFADANPYVTAKGQPYGYPGFGSMTKSTGIGGRYDSIDNFFTRYPGANGATNRTIVNPMNGSPYTVVAPPPAPLNAAAVGNIVVASRLSNPGIFNFAPPAHNGIVDTADGDGSIELEYQEWDNFGLVRSASDHLPLAIDL
jgi:hypothetical protein